MAAVLVSYAAVLCVVTQRSSPHNHRLCGEESGCVADYCCLHLMLNAHNFCGNIFSKLNFLSNVVTVLSDTAKCEFCNYVGIRESFFSKSKRFCKMECAKRYSSASNIKQKSKGDKIGTSKKKHRTSDRHHKVSLKLDLLSNLVTVLSDTAKCEFCCYIGVKENFFSKSKRFCKMECAKRYSASNIKKKSKGEKIGTPKKKHRTSERHHNATAAASALAGSTSAIASTANTASSGNALDQVGDEVLYLL